MAGNQFMAMEGIKLGQLSGILNPKEKWPLKLEAQAVKTKVSIDGSIQNVTAAQGIDLKLNVEGEDLAQFDKFTGEPLPVKGPFRLSGRFVSPSEKTVQVSDLIVVLGESQIQGTVKVTIASKRPLIDAKKKEGLGSKIKNLFSKPKV